MTLVLLSLAQALGGEPSIAPVAEVSASEMRYTAYTAFSVSQTCPALPMMSRPEIASEAIVLERHTASSATVDEYAALVKFCEAWYRFAAIEGREWDVRAPRAVATEAIISFDELLLLPSLPARDRDDYTFFRAVSYTLRDGPLGKPREEMRSYLRAFPSGRWYPEAWVWLGDMEACGCSCEYLPMATAPGE